MSEIGQEHCYESIRAFSLLDFSGGFFFQLSDALTFYIFY